MRLAFAAGLLGVAVFAPILLAPGVMAAEGSGAQLPIGPICGHIFAGAAAAVEAAITPAKMILSGYGTGGFAISTQNTQAQAFFDNGMQLAHAFAHRPATAAFQEARKFDPDCAMCVWGEAWSRGPTINFPIDGDELKTAATMANEAAKVADANGATPRERALIAALQKRYVNGGGSGVGDYAYARAMDDLAKRYPDDNEILVMAADAWMIPAARKSSRENLPRAVELLETVLKRAPNDTGAIHFYIHATEMSGFGARALPYAQKLQTLAPSASHLVHMPSHTYFWVGYYRDAAQSNLDAVEIDKANAKRAGLKGGVFDLPYHGHNVWFGTAAAMMDGDGAAAQKLAGDVIARLPEMQKKPNPWAQLSAGAAYFAKGRYATEAEIAALADPGDKLTYARVMWRYARGEAAARRGDVASVRAELAAMRFTAADAKAFADSPGPSAVKVARLVLEGRAAMLSHDYAHAADCYRRAALIQESSLGGLKDPPIWWFPVRRSYAAALLAQGRPKDAAIEARASLRGWPWDPLAMKVLAEAERGQGQTAAADRDLAIARDGWTGTLTAVPLGLI